MAELPSFPIGPILEYYGSPPIEDGRGWTPIRCPFHEDGDASASYRSDDEQVFKCHSCGMKGNAAQLIMKKEGVGYWDAVARAKGIAEPRNGDVRRFPGRGNAVSRKSGGESAVRAFARTWLRS